MILIVEEPIIFEFEVRLSTQRLMFESLWYKHRYDLRICLNLYLNIRMVKLRRNK